MNAFQTHVLVRYLGEGKWRVEEDLVIDDSELGEFTVPVGFVSDLDSIPRWFPLAHAVVKGASVTSAVAHDYLYEQGEINGDPITQKQADEVYLRAMADEGVPWWKRRMIYRALRIGGFIAWNRHRANDEEPRFV